jgi:hypothetical protein
LISLSSIDLPTVASSRQSTAAPSRQDSYRIMLIIRSITMMVVALIYYRFLIDYSIRVIPPDAAAAALLRCCLRSVVTRTFVRGLSVVRF